MAATPSLCLPSQSHCTTPRCEPGLDTGYPPADPHHHGQPELQGSSEDVTTRVAAGTSPAKTNRQDNGHVKSNEDLSPKGEGVLPSVNRTHETAGAIGEAIEPASPIQGAEAKGEVSPSKFSLKKSFKFSSLLFHKNWKEDGGGSSASQPEEMQEQGACSNKSNAQQRKAVATPESQEPQAKGAEGNAASEEAPGYRDIHSLGAESGPIPVQFNPEELIGPWIGAHTPPCNGDESFRGAVLQSMTPLKHQGPKGEGPGKCRLGQQPLPAAFRSCGLPKSNPQNVLLTTKGSGLKLASRPLRFQEPRKKERNRPPLNGSAP
nr:MARCKS-related protein-like [Macaca fascicularis]